MNALLRPARLALGVSLLAACAKDTSRTRAPNDLLTVGYDRDLNKALEILKTQTQAFLAATQDIAPEKTEEWMATRYDCRIAEVVNQMKGVFCMIPKKGVKLMPSSNSGRRTLRELFTTWSASRQR